MSEFVDHPPSARIFWEEFTVRKMLITLLLVACHAGISAAGVGPSKLPTDDPPPLLANPGGGFVLPSITSTWNGGPTSLAYNNGTSSETLVSQALSIAGVQQVMSALAARGYIRRADADTGFTGTGRSTVILAFEKPGVPPAEQQPFVYVSSFAIYRQDWGGYIPVTMVMGGSASDSAGYPVYRSDPTMPPVGLVSIVNTAFTDGVAGVENEGEVYAFAYSIQPWMYDPGSPVGITFVHNEPRSDVDEAIWWAGYGDAVTKGALVGGISGGIWGAARGGAPGILPGALWGAFSGASTAAMMYQLRNPYPER